MKLSLETGPLHVIASDGGFLPSTVQTDSVIMSPGERYEILVDMQSLDENTLRVTYNDWRSDFLGGLFASGELAALKLIRGAETGFTGSMPQRLANLAPAAPQFAVNRRQFVLNMEDEDGLAALAAAWGNICGAGGMGINGRPMNMDQINERVSIGDYEIWQLWADDNLHPFHIHGCSFRILSQNGAVPPAYAQGWKDMVEVGNDGMTEVLVRFDHAAPEHAPYMYHCHILEHEDCGMMGQFTTA
jgi:FtsP/CotA-like multicopper oxidase with cupredoxin domain